MVIQERLFIIKNPFFQSGVVANLLKVVYGCFHRCRSNFHIAGRELVRLLFQCVVTYALVHVGQNCLTEFGTISSTRRRTAEIRV